jgi:hypothetical protein
MEHINARRLRVMTTTFPIEQVAEAHRAIEDRKTMGKWFYPSITNTGWPE